MNISPFQSVGPYQFGSPRGAIQQLAEGQVRNSDVVISGFTERSDYLVAEEIKVYYDVDNCAEAFEFFKGSLVWQGKELTRMNASELTEYLLSIAEGTTVSENEIEVPSMGIKAIFPDKAMKLVRHFLIYQKGFFAQEAPSPEELINALLGKNGIQ